MKLIAAWGSAPNQMNHPKPQFTHPRGARIPAAYLETPIAIVNTLCQPVCIIIRADTSGELPRK